MRKTKPYRSHEEATIESFRRDPAFAAEYLNAVLKEGDQEELLLALRRVAAAFGGVPKVAKQAELNAKALYRALSPKGNPELRTLSAVLEALKMRLAIVPVPDKKRRAA